jgi:hypothetical protein
VICQISRVLILSHWWWGRMHLLLGIHHTLVWNRVLQHYSGVVVANTVVGPAEVQAALGTWRVHGIFHLFEVGNLGEMVSIMTMLTSKSTREVHLEVVVVVPPLAFFIAPLGVLVPLVLVAPNRLVLLGVISPWSWVIIVSVFSFLFGIIRLMGHIFVFSCSKF